jgi:hypothetical protein
MADTKCIFVARARLLIIILLVRDPVADSIYGEGLSPQLDFTESAVPSGAHIFVVQKYDKKMNWQNNIFNKITNICYIGIYIVLKPTCSA